MGEAQLTMSENFARGVIENLLEGCQIISSEYRYLYVNEAVVRQGSATREQLLGRTMMEVYPGIEHTSMFALLRRCLVDRSPMQMENEFAFRDGTSGWFDLRFEPVPEGVLVLSIEISDRRRAEESLRRTNRALTTLSRCNRTLVHADDERAWVQDLCNILVRSGYRMAWIGFAEKDDARTVRSVATAGADNGYTDGLLVTWDDSPSGSGPTGRAIRLGEVTVARYISAEPDFAPWHEEARARGFASSIALPFRIAGEIAGALNIYAAEPDAFDTHEKELLTEMALDLGYGITTLRERVARVRADEALREVQERYHLLFEHAPVGIAVQSEGRFVFTNPAGARLLGADSPEEIAGKSIADIVPPERLGVARDRIRRLLAGETGLYPTEDLCVRLDGSRVSVEVMAVPLTFMGKPAVQVVVTDITERKQAELALRESEERYRNLVENLEDVVFSLDVDGRIQYVSASIGKYGYTPREMLGEPFARFVHPDDLDVLRERLRLALSGHRAPHVFRVHDKAGEVHIVRTASRPLLSEGRPVGITGLLIDLTEQKRTEEQLRLAQKMEAIGQLAGGVAHDFNNLLLVILSYSEFAGESLREGDPLLGYVTEIGKAAERAAALTRQLLAFSRKQVLEPRVLQLNSIAADLEKMLHRLIGEDIDFVQRLAPDLGLVKADPGQIEQVIMNLVVNARDAMPSGGALTIATANVALDEAYAARHVDVTPGPYVLLAVSDSGCGMDAATRQRLFEPFFTTKEKGKGTGLGLSTVYGIVKQSGGNIWVHSEPNKGTTFKVYLPRVVEASDPSVTSRVSEGPATGTETILVVEDEEGVRNLLARILRKAGYEVLVAAHGGEALLMCEAHLCDIHLLVTDVIMPHMSGPQLAERLQKVRPGLRVLYMSGYTDNAIVHHGVLDPGTRFIGKPFKAVALARKVREVLDEP